jgi:hypothetical protein
VPVYIIVHIYVNKNVCLSGHLDNLIDLAEELDILREPNDIEPNEAGGIEPALLHSSNSLVAASGRGYQHECHAEGLQWLRLLVWKEGLRAVVYVGCWHRLTEVWEFAT